MHALAEASCAIAAVSHPRIPAESDPSLVLLDLGCKAKTCWSASSARLLAAGDKETVLLLLRHGADANADADAGPPLMWATGSRRTGAAAALLEAGADPNRLGPNDVSALLTAAATGGACLQTDEVSPGSAVQSSSLLCPHNTGQRGCLLRPRGSVLAAQGSKSCCTDSQPESAIRRCAFRSGPRPQGPPQCRHKASPQMQSHCR